MRPLVVVNFGSFIGKHSERIVVREKDEVVLEVPFFRVQEVVIGRHGITLSSDFIEEAVRRGTRVSFLGGTGSPFALLTSPHLTATVKTRRDQLAAFQDERGLDLARRIVRAKLRNQANLLKYSGKYLARAEGDVHREVRALAGRIEVRAREVARVAGANVDEARPRLLALEGEAGKGYWRGFELLLRRSDFVGRVHRGATDPVNALLNYGYGILYSKVWSAVLHAGLEPFAGFLHVDRAGKPSLVLDLVEEFRQPVVDRVVLALLNRGERVVLERGRLDDGTRRLIAERVIERLEGRVEYGGVRIRLGSVIQAQAYKVAASFRGEGGYRGYRFRW